MGAADTLPAVDSGDSPTCALAMTAPFLAPASRCTAWFGDRLSDAVKLALMVGFESSGFERSAFASGPMLIVANHVSLLDTLAIRYALPAAVRARTATVGARDFFAPSPTDRGIRRALRACTCSYVTNAYRVCLIGRGDDMGDGIPTITSVLREGWNVILFPEGTRSRSGRMGRFRMGVAHLAATTGVPVLPVGIRGTEGLMPVGSPVIRHGRVVVRAGVPTRIEQGEAHGAFLQRMRAEINGLLAP